MSWLRQALSGWATAQTGENPSMGSPASVPPAAGKGAGPAFTLFQLRFWFKKRQANGQHKQEEGKQNPHHKQWISQANRGLSDSCPDPEALGFLPPGPPQAGSPRKQTHLALVSFYLAISGTIRGQNPATGMCPPPRPPAPAPPAFSGLFAAPCAPHPGQHALTHPWTSCPAHTRTHP